MEQERVGSLAELGIPDGATSAVVMGQAYTYEHSGLGLASVLRCIDGLWYPIAADGWRYSAD